MRATLLTFLALLAVQATAADASFTGYARSLDTGELLYVESHAISDVGARNETRLVLYRCSASSAPFARKQLNYGSARTAPAFDFADARSGFSEGLKDDARGRTVYARAGARSKLRSELLENENNMIADAGFDEFVRERWDALQRGEAQRAPFLVPSLLETIDFRVRKVGQTRIEGEEATVIRLSMAGALGWFLPDIDVSYRQRDRRLMRYRGRTNLRDAAGELLDAQIDFPEAERSDAAVDLAALRAQALSATCR